VLSTSFIAALGEREREAVERAVRALPAAQREPVLLGYSCEVALYERA
jgi:DNA-directed RNA polymerase specialized sigma24 family protein